MDKDKDGGNNTEVTPKPEVKPEVDKTEIESSEEAADTAGTVLDTQEEPSGTQPEEITDESLEGKPPSKKKWIFLVVIVAVILGLVGATVYFFKDQVFPPKEGAKVSAQVTPTPLPSTAPTPTESTRSADLTKYEIKVLNGSGTKGEAGKVQALLEDGGFKVVSTGNAANFDYTQTVIQSKKEVEKPFVDALKKLLEKTYQVGPVEVIDEDGEDEVIVIVGSAEAP